MEIRCRLIHTGRENKFLESHFIRYRVQSQSSDAQEIILLINVNKY